MPTPSERTFGAGPFQGVRYTPEPYDERENLLHLAINGVLDDPEAGCTLASRLGFAAEAVFEPIAPATDVERIQAAYTHIGSDGTVSRFTVCDGVLYNAAGDDVTPENIAIDPDAPRVWMVSLNDSLIVHDGVNTPWIGTNLTSDPITATPITFSEGSVLLSRGSTDTRIAYAAFEYLIQGTFGSKAADPVGVALPAGTVPANQWAGWAVFCNAAGVITVTAADDNYTTGYATEAAARAALPPDRGTVWLVGTFTLQTASGQPFIANTDALQGGASGNPAQVTNYYAGESPAWKAYGQPVVYAGSAVFILDTVDGGPAGAARTSIAWSEPNQPDVGYRQTDYDNVWTLTQTGSAPLYALAATNDALYYARAYSWGALAGSPNINWQNTATHDVVAGNIGCVNSATVQVFRNYVYFVDAIGRPYRFAAGGSPEPIWHQMRQWFTDVRGTISTASVETDWWAVVEPNQNLYIVNAGGDAVVLASNGLLNVLHTFDAETGIYTGQWVVPTVQGTDYDNPVAVQLGAVTQLTADEPPTLSLFRPYELTDTSIRVVEVRQYPPVEAEYADDVLDPANGTGDGTQAVSLRLVTPWFGYSLRKTLNVSEVLSAIWFGDDPPDVTMRVDTPQIGNQTPTVTLPTGGGDVVSNADPVVSYSGDRYVLTAKRGTTGRGARVVLTATAGQNAADDPVGQVFVHRVELTAVQADTTVRDR